MTAEPMVRRTPQQDYNRSCPERSEARTPLVAAALTGVGSMASVKGLAADDGALARGSLVSAAARVRGHRVDWQAIGMLVLWSGLAVVTFPPAITPSGTIDLDSQWQLALAVGLRSHLQF